MSKSPKPRRRKPLPNGARAIMGSRKEPPDSLDYFPTPPWATRALMERVLPPAWDHGNDGWPRHYGVWEPACGEGHMAEVLREYFGDVRASDVFDYDCGYEVGSFTGIGADVAPPRPVDWIITNPPFNGSIEFVVRALELTTVGVAMFVRSTWAIEGGERYERVFRDTPPTLFAPFMERVPLCKGRWDPDGTTATAYCWLVWVKGREPMPPFYIPPGQRKALTRPDDRARFAAWSLPESFDNRSGLEAAE